MASSGLFAVFGGLKRLSGRRGQEVAAPNALYWGGPGCGARCVSRRTRVFQTPDHPGDAAAQGRERRGGPLLEGFNPRSSGFLPGERGGRRRRCWDRREPEWKSAETGAAQTQWRWCTSCSPVHSALREGAGCTELQMCRWALVNLNDFFPLHVYIFSWLNVWHRIEGTGIHLLSVMSVYVTFISFINLYFNSQVTFSLQTGIPTIFLQNVTKLKSKSN